VLELPLATQERRGRHRKVGAVEARYRRGMPLFPRVAARRGGGGFFRRLPPGARRPPFPVWTGGSAPPHTTSPPAPPAAGPAAPAGCDAGAPVYRHSHAALLAQEWSAGVDADAHPDRTRAESLRPFRGCLECPRRGGEGDEEGVSLRVDLHPSVALEGLAQKP